MTMPWDKDWENLYSILGISDFITFITSAASQDALLPIKLVFILFALFFLCAVIYFYMNSSYLTYQFVQDVTEFFSWQAYGLQEVERRWKSITKRIKTGSEKEYKLAIMEAEDFLYNELVDAEHEGKTIEAMIESARRIMPNFQDVLEAHKIRDAVARDVNYKLDTNLAKKILKDYEKAIKDIYSY